MPAAKQREHLAEDFRLQTSQRFGGLRLDMGANITVLHRRTSYNVANVVSSEQRKQIIEKEEEKFTCPDFKAQKGVAGGFPSFLFSFFYAVAVEGVHHKPEPEPEP